MKTAIVILALSVGVLYAGAPPEGSTASSGFDQLKTLVGEWKGKDSDGKPVTITYKLVSMGTALMETLDMGEEHGAMITMYHLDGKRLMMTHYCSMGNQPRMRAENMAKDGKLAFSMVDITNRASSKDNYMKKLIFTFKDGDHFSQEWTMRMEGKMDHPSSFDFERAKQ